MTPILSGSASISLAKALAPELVLAAGSLVLLLAAVWLPQRTVLGAAEGADRTPAITRLALVLCLITAVVVLIAWGDSVSGSPDLRLAGDPFRWVLSLMLIAGTAGALVLLDAEHRLTRAFSPEVPVLMLFATVGMLVLAAARDLMLIFLGIELMSLAAYVLAGVNRRSARGAEAAVKYFLLGAVASGFLLYGMALLFGATGGTRLVDLARWAAMHPDLSPWYLAGLALLLVGIAFKIAAVPFHAWTPDVYEGAPLPVTAFMATCVKTAGFAVLGRLLVEAFPLALPKWHAVIWWLAVLSMLFGNLLALAQRNLVRMLAYSSIAHAGYLLVGLVAGSAAGVSAVIFYAVTYGLATLGLYGILIAVTAGRERAPSVEDIAGLWLVRPWLAGAMAVFLLAFLGIPVLGGAGFFAKWFLLRAALQASAPQTVLSVVLVLASALSAAYYLRVIAGMFTQARPADAPLPQVSRGSGVLIIVAVSGLLLLGLQPMPLASLADDARVAPAGDRGGPPVSKDVGPLQTASGPARTLP